MRERRDKGEGGSISRLAVRILSDAYSHNQTCIANIKENLLAK